MEKETNVFISYAREDHAIAYKIYNDLKKLGIKVWIDKEELRPGEKWKTTIKQTIKSSSHFLALFSSNSLSKKGFVQKEVKIAIEVLDELPDSEIYFIPIRLNECKIADEKLQDIQWVDFFPSYDEGLNQVVRVLKPESKSVQKEKNKSKIYLITLGLIICLVLFFIGYNTTWKSNNALIEWYNKTNKQSNLDGFNGKNKPDKEKSKPYISKAIIVAGGGSSPKNIVWDNTQMVANFAYKTLLSMGFTKENIYYLTAIKNLDLDNNGNADELLINFKREIFYNAITIWAKESNNLIIYFVGNGSEDKFLITDNEILTSFELNSWLNSLQHEVRNRVVFIYDSCMSGSFIKSLKSSFGSDRILITSCSENEKAWSISKGRISFSYYFWSNIFNGSGIYEAFINAKQALNLTVHPQTPLLDANSNGIYNEKEDFKIVKDMYLNK